MWYIDSVTAVRSEVIRKPRSILLEVSGFKWSLKLDETNASLGRYLEQVDGGEHFEADYARIGAQRNNDREVADHVARTPTSD